MRPGGRTVHRTIDVLSLLAEHPEGLALKDVCAALQIPKSSAHDIVQALLSRRMIDRVSEDDPRYTIGLKAFHLGRAYLSHTDLIRVCRPHVRALAESLEQTAFVAVLDGDSVTYLHKVEPRRAIITTANVGTRNPAHCTSLGKAILSGMDEAALEEALGGLSWEQRTPRSHTSAAALRPDLEQSARRGYAVDDGEIEELVLCVGAPIFDHEGQPIAAISVSGLRGDEAGVAQLGEAVRRTAEDVSSELGFGGRGEL